MSRIGKQPIVVPNGTTVTLDGQTVKVKGPKGELTWSVAPEIELKLENGELTLAPRDDTPRARSMGGLSRSLVGNMVTGAMWWGGAVAPR